MVIQCIIMRSTGEMFNMCRLQLYSGVAEIFYTKHTTFQRQGIHKDIYKMTLCSYSLNNIQSNEAY